MAAKIKQKVDSVILLHTEKKEKRNYGSKRNESMLLLFPHNSEYPKVRRKEKKKKYLGK